VASARCIVRLLPRAQDGQRVIDSGLEVSPQPTEKLESLDYFNNRIAVLRIAAAHRVSSWQH
jgi:hypothetical protein